MTVKNRRNTAGLRRGGGRPKGVPNKVTTEIKDITRNIFDAAYFASVKARLAEGKLAPAVECRLLGYAFGEPKQSIDLDANIRTVAKVVHEHRTS